MAQTPPPQQVADELWSLPVISIEQALDDADADTVPDRIDEPVHVRGTVMIPPGVLAEQFFQVSIYDGTKGISLFSYELSMELSVGDEVEAIGEVGQYRGAPQLQKVQVRKLGTASLPEAQPMTVAQAASWDQFGKLVRVSGRIDEVEVRTSGTLPMRGDDGGSITLFFPQKVMRNFPFADYPTGAKVQAEGLISIYDQSWPFDGGFQLVVTSPDDLALIAPPPAGWKKALGWAIGVFVVLAIVAGLVLLRIHRRQKEGERELATLSRLSSTLSAPELTPAALSQQACEALVESGLMRSVLVHLFDETGVLRLSGAAGDSADAALAVIPAASTARVPDTDQLKDEFSQVSLQLVSVVTIQAAGKPVGILTALDRVAGSPTVAQQRALLTAAQLLGLGLAHQKVQQRALVDSHELKQLATTDDLTGLYNRRFLDDFLHVHFPMAQRGNHPLAFIAIDLDHFKKVNDRYGHASGDRVLQCVAECLKEQAGSGDLPVRLGGEEFLVVMPEAGVEQAVAASESIRQCIAGYDWEQAIGKPARITVSLGVAVFPDHCGDLQSLRDAADAALYASKRSGRDRVSVAEAANV